MVSGIYKIENKINGRFYIGSAVNIKKRWAQHRSQLKHNRHENVFLQRCWNKYGSSNFIFTIIECVPADNLLEREQFYLDILCPYSPVGYNIGTQSSGGDNMTEHPHKEQIIIKIKRTLKAKIDSMSDEERSKKWGRHGENNPNFGKKWDLEQRRKASIRMKNIMKNEANKKLLSNRLKQWWSNPENREQMSKVFSKKIGEKNSFFGKHHSDQTKEKISNLHKERFLKLSPEDRAKLNPQIRKVSINDIVYHGISEAARQLGVCTATICHRIKSKNIKFKDYFYVD